MRLIFPIEEPDFGLGFGDPRDGLVARLLQIVGLEFSDEVALMDDRLFLHGQADDPVPRARSRSTTSAPG